MHEHPPVPPLELEGVDPLSMRVFAAYMRTVGLHRQLMARAFGERGTHPGQVFCLRLLAQHDGMSQRDLARVLHFSRSRVTMMLQAMEKQALLLRRPDEADQRLTRVYLTDEGRRLDKDLRALAAQQVNATFGALTREDRLQMERLLQRLEENVVALLNEKKETAAS